MKKYLAWVATAMVAYAAVGAYDRAKANSDAKVFVFDEMSLEVAELTDTKPEETDKPEWQASKKHQRAELYLTAIIFGECRGQSDECRYAVAHVAMNRAKLNLDKRYGKGLWGVISKRKQFSCLNKNDPAYPLIQKGMKGKLKPGTITGDIWEHSAKIAHEMMHVGGEDPTNGATHYHAKWMKAKWVNDRGMKKVADMDGHLFYKLTV